MLVLGDLHIPHRVFEIPEKFQKILVRGGGRGEGRAVCGMGWSPNSTKCPFPVGFPSCQEPPSSHATIRMLYPCAWMQLPGKMGHVICTGNLCNREQLDALKALAPQVHAVAGDFDEVGWQYLPHGGALHPDGRCAVCASM